MRKIVFSLWLVSLFIFAGLTVAQERFNDVRQKVADSLTALKTSVSSGDFENAQKHLDQAVSIWESEVKPMIREGVKSNEQFREYFERMDEVDRRLANLSQMLKTQETRELESEVNAVIWGISHHPRGFNVPQPRYSTWDWVFGLGIGIGFCGLAVVFGLYLRKSYYRRYKRQGEDSVLKG